MMDIRIMAPVVLLVISAFIMAFLLGVSMEHDAIYEQAGYQECVAELQREIITTEEEKL